MSNDSRDEFSPKTRLALADRVGNLCSICEAPTSGPSSDCQSAMRIGVAAHITAAKGPRGPRYDATLTSEERKSAYNGIWLCENCSTEVDKTPQQYSVWRLFYLKIKAEERAGRRVPGSAGLVSQESVQLLADGDAEMALEDWLKTTSKRTARFHALDSELGLVEGSSKRLLEGVLSGQGFEVERKGERMIRFNRTGSRVSVAGGRPTHKPEWG